MTTIIVTMFISVIMYLGIAFSQGSRSKWRIMWVTMPPRNGDVWARGTWETWNIGFAISLRIG